MITRTKFDSEHSVSDIAKNITRVAFFIAAFSMMVKFLCFKYFLFPDLKLAFVIIVLSSSSVVLKNFGYIAMTIFITICFYFLANLG